jgi:hypothetical protein
MTAAPFDFYGVNDTELHDELRNIDVECTVDFNSPVIVSAGVRRCPLGGPNYPVNVVRAADGLHLLALPNTEVAS